MGQSVPSAYKTTWSYGVPSGGQWNCTQPDHTPLLCPAPALPTPGFCPPAPTPAHMAPPDPPTPLYPQYPPALLTQEILPGIVDVTANAQHLPDLLDDGHWRSPHIRFAWWEAKGGLQLDWGGGPDAGLGRRGGLLRSPWVG